MDFIPTSLIKSCLSVFIEIITTLTSLSIDQGIFSSRFKLAQVTPLLKKAGLDKSSPSSNRPISNLNNISKLLERLILIRIRDHISFSSTFNPFQSAYRKYYSTEAALLLALDNVYRSINQGSSTLLVSLDFSAAFDTLDHDILLNRLHTSFGISGPVFDWFHSNLSPRNQFVRIQSALSATTQGSVFDPVLFFLYISPIAHIAAAHGFMQQQYRSISPSPISIETLISPSWRGA